MAAMRVAVMHCRFRVAGLLLAKSGLFFPVMRMVCRDGIAQILVRKVSVNLCGADFLVSEHFLHSTQVGSVGDQLRSKTMAQTMWRNSLFDTRFAHGLLEEHEDIVAREMRTQSVDEHIVLFTMPDFLMRPYRFDILEHKVQRGAVDGHPSLLVAFAGHEQALVVDIDVGEVQIDEL